MFTYTSLLTIGVFIIFGYVVLSSRQSGAVADVLIAGLIGGVLLARGGHILLNWAYFDLHRDEIRFIEAGGLSWHGAVIGAFLAMTLAARIRQVEFAPLLGKLAFALPLLALMAWWGCSTNHCAYGAEVDNLSHYPSWLVWERFDIYNIRLPRYATQPIGMAFSLGLLILVITFNFVGEGLKPAPTKTFFITLILLSIGMFIIGFLRGDYSEMVGGLRLDQWFDLIMLCLGFIGLQLYNKPMLNMSKEPAA